MSAAPSAAWSFRLEQELDKYYDERAKVRQRWGKAGARLDKLHTPREDKEDYDETLWVEQDWAQSCARAYFGHLTGGR